MLPEYMPQDNDVQVSATISSPNDITAATPAIALHDNTGDADVYLPSTWSTAPTFDSRTGLWSGVAQTTGQIDFTTKALGTYIVRGKAGTTVVDCYILHVIP